MDTDGTQEILARYHKMRKALVGASAVLENNADQRRSAFIVALGASMTSDRVSWADDPKPLFAFRELMSALWDLDQGTTVPLLRAKDTSSAAAFDLPNKDFFCIGGSRDGITAEGSGQTLRGGISSLSSPHIALVMVLQQ
jgi:hypothetical protein